MRIVLSALATLATIVFCATAHAAKWEGVFEGTLGKAHVIVELNAGEEKTEYKGSYSDGSRYSYLPKARDLHLALDAEGDTLSFSESPSPEILYPDMNRADIKITGLWSLKVDGGGASGTWSSPDGKKKLPITLKRLPLVAMAEVTEGNSQLTATYNARWFREVKITGAAKPVSFGKVTLAFEKDSAFGLEMPVLTAMPDTDRMAKANDMLRRYYRKSLMGNRDCINGINTDTTGEGVEYGFTISYASERVLSISESGSVYCGGAHPNNYVQLLTWDLVTPAQIGGVYGLDLKPEGFGQVLKLANKDERIAFEAFAMGRWMEAAKAAGETGDESCAGMGFNDGTAAGEREFSLEFLPGGLGVQRTDYPHVASNCLFQDFNPTVIPWKDLKSFLRPGQTLLTEELKP